MRIENLCKRYDGRSILDGLTLDLPDGGIYSIMGASGVGKTTLLQILLGLVEPEEGQIFGLSGKRFSAVFQEDRLCDFLTAAENIIAVCPGRHIRNHMAISQLNDRLAELLPEESLRQPVSTYSKGMKRRAAIARAVLTDSDILVMDEPFSGLDAKTKRQTVDFLLRYRQERTLILTTHDAEDAELLGAVRIWLGSDGAEADLEEAALCFDHF